MVEEGVGRPQGINASASRGIAGSLAQVAKLRLYPVVHRLPRTVAHSLVLILIVAVSGWWRAANLDAFGISNDEGSHLMWAKLANEGYALYSQTHAVQAPLFIALIQLSFKLLGAQAASGRWMEIGLGLVTLLGVGLLARQLRGWLAAWTAAATLSVAPLFFQYSRIIRGDVGASAFLALALLSGYLFWRRGQRAWLALAGVLLAANLLVKATSPLAFSLIVLLILRRRLAEGQGGGPSSLRAPRPARRSPSGLARELAADVLIFGLGLAAPIALCFVAYDAAGLFDALVAFRLDLRSSSPWNPAANAAELGRFVRQNAALTALAAYGWLALLLGERRAQGGNNFVGYAWCGDAALMGLWLAITLFALFSHTPLFPHHLISWLLPMAILAGVAVEDAVQGLVHWLAERTRWPVGGLVGLALIGFYLASLPGWLAADQHMRREVTGGREAEAVGFLQTVVPPGSFIISDNQMLTFMAGRRSPPPLGDIALVAIRSGRQTTERLVALSRDYPVEAVATWSHRLPWLPDYLAWVEDNYLLRREWDPQHVIYFGRRIPAGQVPNRREARLGEAIQLLGYQVERTAPETSGAGQGLEVIVFWRAEVPVGADYTVFVQLLDAAGRLVAQHDGQPLYGYLPTGAWPPGEVISDRHAFRLPQALPPGRYQLIAGMYRLETLERLPVQMAGGEAAGDTVALTEIEIGD